jgi:hypothetical protein
VDRDWVLATLNAGSVPNEKSRLFSVIAMNDWEFSLGPSAKHWEFSPTSR